MQSEEIQIKTTSLSLYLLKHDEHEDEWFKEHHKKIIDDSIKKSDWSTFLGEFSHPLQGTNHLYVSFVTKENQGASGLRYPIRAICYLDHKELSRGASTELKSFLKQKRIKYCPASVLDEILRRVAETFPGVPVAELEAS